MLLALPVLTEQLRKAKKDADVEPKAWHQKTPLGNPFSSGGNRYRSQTREPTPDIRFGRPSSVEKIEPVFVVPKTGPRRPTAGAQRFLLPLNGDGLKRFAKPCLLMRDSRRRASLMVHTGALKPDSQGPRVGNPSVARTGLEKNPWMRSVLVSTPVGCMGVEC